MLKGWAYMLRGEEMDGLIRQIEGGIKKEVSIGCAVRRKMCSICGEEYGACGHVKGETYGTERCAAVLCEAVDAYEFSFVAVPAQKKAGVLKKQTGGEGALDEVAMKRLQKDAELGKAYREDLTLRARRAAMLLSLAWTMRSGSGCCAQCRRRICARWQWGSSARRRSSLRLHRR